MFKGFYIVELLLVLMIVGILVSIALPNYIGRVEKIERDLCEINRHGVLKQYEMDLVLDRLDHTDFLIKEFMDKNGLTGCSVGGAYTYRDGEVVCDQHGREDEDGDEVPWL